MDESPQSSRDSNPLVLAGAILLAMACFGSAAWTLIDNGRVLVLMLGSAIAFAACIWGIIRLIERSETPPEPPDVTPDSN
jgi:hypothetical protein